MAIQSCAMLFGHKLMHQTASKFTNAALKHCSNYQKFTMAFGGNVDNLHHDDSHHHHYQLHRRRHQPITTIITYMDVGETSHHNLPRRVPAAPQLVDVGVVQRQPHFFLGLHRTLHPLSHHRALSTRSGHPRAGAPCLMLKCVFLMRGAADSGIPMTGDGSSSGEDG